MITWTCCKFLLILGELWSYFVHFVSKYKNSYVCTNHGELLQFSLEHSFTHIVISLFMWLIGSSVKLVQLISFVCLLQLVSFDCLIACFSLFMSLWHIILLLSLCLNIVCVPPSIYLWICVLHSTHLLRNTQFMEDHNLYWLSKLFAHFVNRCQWGRSSREFCGQV